MAARVLVGGGSAIPGCCYVVAIIFQMFAMVLESGCLHVGKWLLCYLDFC